MGETGGLVGETRVGDLHKGENGVEKMRGNVDSKCVEVEEKTERCVRQSEAWKGESERGLKRDLKTYIQIVPTS